MENNIITIGMMGEYNGCKCVVSNISDTYITVIGYLIPDVNIHWYYKNWFFKLLGLESHKIEHSFKWGAKTILTTDFNPQTHVKYTK